MSNGLSTKIALGAGLVIAIASRPARAQESCEGVRLDLADDLSPTWRDAGNRLRSELTASDAPCVSATLVVENAANGAARLSATTPDGRHTERVLTKANTLVPTALGIVASLPPDAVALTTATKAPTTSDSRARFETSATDTTDAELPIAREEATTPQLWAGASAGGRIGAPTLLAMLDIEGHVSLETNRWLVVGSFRYGTSLGESAVSADDSYYELVGSLGGGRRFQIGASSLDVVLSPEISSSNLDDNDDDNEVARPGSARIEARLGASMCWWTTFRDESRIGVSLDTDVAPYGLFRGVRSAETEPAIPVWTAGLQVSVAGRIL